MKKVLMVLAALSMLLCTATAQANLIGNGGFDTGLDGWITTGGVVWDSGAADLAGYYGADGSTLTQFIRVAPGTKSLTLSFDLNINLSTLLGGVGSAGLAVHFNSADIGINDLVLYTWSWAELTAPFTQKTLLNETISVELDFNRVLPLPLDNAMISFVFGYAGTYGSFNAMLDNVVLGAGTNAVPVPAAVWLLGTGLAGIAAMRRKALR